MKSYFGNEKKNLFATFSAMFSGAPSSKLLHFVYFLHARDVENFFPQQFHTYRHTFPHGYTKHIKKTSTISCEAELLNFVKSNEAFWLKCRKVLGTPNNLLISLRWDRTMLILTWWVIKLISYKKVISSFSVNKLALLFTLTVRVLTLNRQLLCEVWRAAGSDALL